MAKSQQVSFGDLFAKGQQLLTFIQSLSNYNPPNEALKKDKFKDLLNKIDNSNSKVANTDDLLATARAKRMDLYYGKEGVKKRCAMVRDFVGVLPAGKTTPAYIAIQKEVQKMNNYKKPTKKEEIAADNEAPAKRKISTSETSFGAILQSAKKVLEIIKNIAEYAPVNALITLEGFTQFVADIEAANQAVNAQLLAHNEATAKRQDLYEGDKGLRACFQDIKSFIAASYGKDSAEFKEVSKIKLG